MIGVICGGCQLLISNWFEFMEESEKPYTELLKDLQQQIMLYKETTSRKLQKIEDFVEVTAQQMEILQKRKFQQSGLNKLKSPFVEAKTAGSDSLELVPHIKLHFPNYKGGNNQQLNYKFDTEICTPKSSLMDAKEELTAAYEGAPIFDEDPSDNIADWHCNELLCKALGLVDSFKAKQNSDSNSSDAKGLECTSVFKSEDKEDIKVPTEIRSQMSKTLTTFLKLEEWRTLGLQQPIPCSHSYCLDKESCKSSREEVLIFDPGGSMQNSWSKSVMNLGVNLQLSQYIPSLENLTTLRLLQQISQEFDDNNRFEGFWLLKNSPGPVVEHGFCEKESTTPLMSQLKSNGMVRWGIRRQVKFLNSLGDNSTGHPQSSASFVRGAKEKLQSDEDNVAEKHEQEGEDNDEDEEEEEIENELYEDNKETVKRKRYSLRENARKAKEVKRSKQKQVYKKKTKNKCKKMIVGHSINRWSAERYKLAERNLLEVMKAKGAVFNSPILRPELRLEARKRIGDTGLLDHLLKHVFGKLAPGGAERLRRRHNADGAMEYWLESADLVRVRKEAGVQDPYWTPPLGWTPGDCPFQDPTCAKEFRLLKEENAKIKRDMENMLSKKQLKEELQNFIREINVQFSKMPEEILALKVQSSGAIPQNLNIDASLRAPWKSDSDSDSALVQVNKQTKQLTDISDSLRGMKDEIRKLNSMVGFTIYIFDPGRNLEIARSTMRTWLFFKEGELSGTDLVQGALKMGSLAKTLAVGVNCNTQSIVRNAMGGYMQGGGY